MIAEIEGQLRGTPLVVMLDIDGTLCNLMPQHEHARVPDETRDVLKQLMHMPDVHVAFVTGRSVADALRIVGIDGIHIHGNHGIEIVGPDGTVEIDVAARNAELPLRTAAATLERVARDVPGVSIEDKRYTLSLHYRLAPAESVDRLRDTVQDIGERLGLVMTEGNHVLELRPPNAADKGRAVLRIAREHGANTAPASLLFAGDDLSDEDAFRALRSHLPQAVTISVGDRVPVTAARYRLADPGALHEVLERIVAHRVESTAGGRV
jgi:trehalose-phosphatase